MDKSPVPLSASTLVHRIRKAHDDNWRIFEESDGDIGYERIQVREMLREQFSEEVAKVGEAEYLAAVFIEKAGPGAIHAVPASEFVWMSLDYNHWSDVARKVVAVPHAWYDLMWFLIGTLGIDYFHLVESLGSLSEDEIQKQRRHYPSQIRIGPEASDLSAGEIAEQRQFAELKERLLAQGAKAAVVREPDDDT